MDHKLEKVTWLGDGCFMKGMVEAESVQICGGIFCGNILPIVISSATLIIGILAAVGVFTGASLFSAGIGLGTTATVLTLANGGFKKPSQWIAIAMHVAIMLLASECGLTGILSSAQVGYGFIGAILGGTILQYSAFTMECGRYAKLHSKRGQLL